MDLFLTSAEGPAAGTMLNAEWLSCFAAVGVVEADEAKLARWRPTGAGVFVSAHGVTWLVTADHVIPAEPAPRVAVRVDILGRSTLVRVWEAHNKVFGLGWVRDPGRDLAACVLPEPRGVRLKTVSPSLWAPLDLELTTLRCLTGGFGLGVPGLDPTHTLVFDGIVAGVDRPARRIYLTAPTYPGNSGGPLFVERPPSDPASSATFGSATILLAGVVQSSTHIDVPVHERPLSLGLAAHIQQVSELLDGPKNSALSSKAQQQLIFARRAG